MNMHEQNKQRVAQLQASCKSFTLWDDDLQIEYLFGDDFVTVVDHDEAFNVVTFKLQTIPQINKFIDVNMLTFGVGIKRLPNGKPDTESKPTQVQIDILTHVLQNIMRPLCVKE